MNTEAFIPHLILLLDIDVKIKNLLEAEFNTTQKLRKFRKGTFKFAKDMRNTDEFAEKSGRFARAHSTGDPHTIVKKSHFGSNPKKDAYYTYASAIAKTGIAKSNPYFPRIYDIQTLRDANKKIKYRIEMERLKEANEVNDEIITSIIEHIFTDESINAINKNFTQYKPLEKLTELIRRYIFSNNIWKLEVKDDKFIEASNFIQKVMKSGGFEDDLHGGNIMFRLSPYPQVVITDPIR